ncbi:MULTISPECIES: hypothetical protein [Bacillus]|uniref:hypothetical protein n=1 Tax=Bacillus amyloliquefaciens group TaxID=1938374 RepID=UPI0018E70E64|nr:hypothetical protein [Bacillus velezensis]
MAVLQTIADSLVVGDAMNNLVGTGKSIIKWLQGGAIVSTAIAFCFGGYLLIWGGDRGRHKCIPWFIGSAVGLVIIMGCYQLAQAVDANVKF